MIRRIQFFAIGLALTVGWFLPYSALAVEVTTSADIRAATAFATELDFCETKKKIIEDGCFTQTVHCDAGKWKEYVNLNVEVVGGTVQKRETGISGYFKPFPEGVKTFLSKSPENRTQIPSLTTSVCKCACTGSSSNPACAEAEEGTVYAIGEGQLGDILLTNEECSVECYQNGDDVAKVCAGKLSLINEMDPNTAEGQSAIAELQDSAGDMALCFSPTQCSEQGGEWEVNTACPGGDGYCYAPPPTVKLNTAIGNVTSVSGFNNYIIIIFRYMLSIVVFVTTVMFIWGAFRYLIGTSMGNVGRGKEIMKDAVIGMILLLCSVAILRTINPATLNLNKIRLPMVNTKLFVQSMYCADLGANVSLVDVSASSETDSDQSSKTAECGRTYVVKNSTSKATCQGTFCSEPMEACVSCASGNPVGCNGLQSDKKVCSKVEFAGSIEYFDGRYPEEVYLIAVCNGASDNGSSTDMTDFLDVPYSDEDVNDKRVSKQQSGKYSDASEIGNADYAFDLDKDELIGVANDCADRGGLRGYLLGVQYNDSGYVDDFTLLDHNDCGGASLFSGYANGSTGSDTSEILQAFTCGLNKNPKKFSKDGGGYWTQNDLLAAERGGSPITCNFRLDEKSAPVDPGGKNPYCNATAEFDKDLTTAIACANGVKHGSACSAPDSQKKCKLNNNTICKCTANEVQYVGPYQSSGGATFGWKCESK
jgi:hypothetical protein